MKRLLALFLSCTLLFTGCVGRIPDTSEQDVLEKESTEEDSSELTQEVNFEKLSDPKLLAYVENTIYTELIEGLNSEEYFVEKVEAIYYSQEYLEEVAYNSQSNIYFGYTLAELNEYFDGERFVFTLGEDGKTIVKPFEKYDDTYDRVLRNVGMGTGVIFICVTVSVLTGGVAPAVSMIFAASAKSGTIMALSSGAISTIATGIVTGMQTHDFDETVKAMALAGSESFKMGAFSGAIAGGVGEAVALKGATLKGLSMSEAALIQRESKLPLEFIKNFHSMKEYNIYKTCNLKLAKVNGKWAYTQNIDWDFVGDVEDGRTNAQRVIDGLAPLDKTGKSYELHHIGQQSNSPLAILTNSEHKSNYKDLHANTGASPSEIDRTLFEKEKREFWLTLLKMTRGIM